MNTRVTPVGNLTGEQVRLVLIAAKAAPSPYDSRPWCLRCTPTAIKLYADTAGEVPAAAPDYRELLLACGAALLNLRVAIRALGVYPAVQQLPDSNQPELLAIVRPQGRGEATPADQRLAEAIARLHTHRHPFGSTTVPVPLLNGLRQAAKIEKAWMATLAPAQLPILRTLIGQAEFAQQHDPAFITERPCGSGRDVDSAYEVPLSGRPPPTPPDESELRDFTTGQARSRAAGNALEPGSLIAVIGSAHDLPLARLQAGQAMQRVLLAATAAGLSASFLSQVVEVPATRRQLREVIGGGLWPQTVLRLGYESPIPPVPSSPGRRTPGRLERRQL
jgi:hypothetical protein